MTAVYTAGAFLFFFFNTAGGTGAPFLSSQYGKSGWERDAPVS